MFPVGVIGACLKTATQDELQALAERRDEIQSRLVEQLGAGECAGALILDTCNRFEVVVELAREGQLRSLRDIAFRSLPPVELHERQGLDAVGHLLKIATGLESLVTGEEQILGQVSRAFREAADHDMLSRRLHMLWSRLMHSARTLRRGHPGAGAPRSVAALAARVAREAGPRVAVLGAGATGRAAVEELRRLRVSELWIYNRTLTHAQSCAEHFGGRGGTLDAFRADPADVDALVVATRGHRLAVPLNRMPSLRTIVDITQPSVLEGAVRREPRVQVIGLEALRQRAEAATAALSAWVDEAVRLAQTHAERIWQELVAGRADLGRLVDLHVENAQAEVERARHRQLRGLDDAQFAEILSLAERIAKRNAHIHLVDVRRLTSP
ncbi:MAG: hypothetical protein AAF628_05240 [Planctomycetota bacterium]